MKRLRLCAVGIFFTLLSTQYPFAQQITQTSTTISKTSVSNQDSMLIKYIDRLSIEYYGEVIDSATKEPIQSAVVYLMGISDVYKDIVTKSTITDKKGKFKILVSGPSKLEVSCLGYKLYTTRVSPPMHKVGAYSINSMGQIISNDNSIDLGKIILSPDPYNADEVVVRARINMYEQRGDTTRIFPRLTKTLEGDALLEVIRQIPGFKVENNVIYDNGKPIERTYVNNTLLFGEEPITAFLKLSAESALMIDTYDEKVSDSEKNILNKDTDTRRVANITTTRDINKYITMDFSAETGIDHDKDIDGDRHKRYGLFGELGIYRVGKQLSVKVDNNNMPNMRYKFLSTSNDDGYTYFSSGNPQQTDFNLSYSRQFYDSTEVAGENKKQQIPKGRLSSDYNFSNRRTSTESKSTSKHFPSNYFESQIIENSNRSLTKTQQHSARVHYYNYSRSTKLPIGFSLNTNIQNGDSYNESLSSTTKDNINISNTNNENSQENNRTNFSTSLSISPTLTKSQLSSLRLDVDADFRYSKNKGDGFRNYTLEDLEGTNLTNLTIESDSPNKNIGISAGLSFHNWVKESFRTEVRMRYGYTQTKEHNVAINQVTNEVDMSYSGEFIRNEELLQTEIMFCRNWSQKQSSINLSFTYNNNRVKNDERIPNDAFLSKSFDYLTFNFSSTYKNLSLYISSSCNIPSVNQLSNILDNTNPMSLNAGNPDLNMSRIYRGALSYTNRKYNKAPKVNFNSNISFSLYTDPIISLRQYFPVTTILEKYQNYEAPAGAVLYTPMNVDKYISTYGEISLSHMIQPINTSLGLALNGSFSNPLSNINDELMRNKQRSAGVNLSIISTPSRKFRIHLKNYLDFNWQENDSFKDRSMSNDFSLNVRYDFLSRLSICPMYTNRIQKAYTTGQTIKQNALNISVGARLLKKRNGLLFVNLYNIFNDKPGYNLNVTDQAIMESWSQIFSRFYSISFQYRFNSLDHSR